MFPTWEGDCFSGVVIGNWFSVAYRTYYDWDRRSSYACARAMGFVRQKDGKTVVSYVTSRGLFSLFWICLFSVILLVPILMEAPGNLFWSVVLSTVFSTILCASTAFFDSMTDCGEEAARTMRRFIAQPHTFVGHEKNH